MSDYLACHRQSNELLEWIHLVFSGDVYGATHWPRRSRLSYNGRCKAETLRFLILSIGKMLCAKLSWNAIISHELKTTQTEKLEAKFLIDHQENQTDNQDMSNQVARSAVKRKNKEKGRKGQVWCFGRGLLMVEMIYRPASWMPEDLAPKLEVILKKIWKGVDNRMVAKKACKVWGLNLLQPAFL